MVFKIGLVQDIDRWQVRITREILKGDTGKQALKLICLQFLQFLTYVNEILSISFFFPARLNRAIRFDLTLLHSAHLALQSAHFALFSQLSLP